MDLRVVCPNDGRVDVPIENLSAILVYGTEVVDMVMTCPHCGEDIHLRARVPDLLVTMMEAVEEMGFDTSFASASFGRLLEDAPLGEAEEGYLGYFHRQLERADTVEAMLAEIDAR